MIKAEHISKSFDGRAVLDTSPWSTHTYLLAAEGARAQATLKIARKH